MTDPQVLQTAINGAANAHTGLHQAIHELRHGSVIGLWTKRSVRVYITQ